MGNPNTGLPSNVQGHWVAVLTTCDFTLRKLMVITLEIKKKGAISYCCSWPHGCRSRKWCDHMSTLQGNNYSDITVFGDTRQSGKFKQYTSCERRCILISFKGIKLCKNTKQYTTKETIIRLMQKGHCDFYIYSVKASSLQCLIRFYVFEYSLSLSASKYRRWHISRHLLCDNTKAMLQDL